MELNRARQHMARKEWAEARQVLEALLATQSGVGDVWNELGVVRFSMGELKKAAEAFRHALECTPPCIAAYGTFASLLLQKGLDDAALLMLKTWVSTYPDDAAAKKTFTEVLDGRRRRGGGKILFIMEEGIGNMVMATPALRALHEAAKMRIHVLGKRPALDVVEGWECVERVLERPGDHFYDLILLSIWCQSSWTAFGAGLAKNAAKIVKVSRTDLDRHEADYHLDLIRAAGLSLQGIPGAHCQKSSATPDMTLPEGRPWVGLSNTALANGGWERKRWTRFRELAVELDRRGYQIVLFGGEHERKQFNPDGWPETLLNVQGRLTVQQTAHLLSLCRLVIATDSGPAHIAAAVGVPTYVLFGSTMISKNKPVGRQVMVISKELPCSPCQYTERWSSCTNWRCMSDIAVKDVLRAIDRDGFGRTEPRAGAAVDGRSKKVLIVGVLDVASSTNGFMKKGFEANGCVVDAYNYRTRQSELGSAEAMWNDFRGFLQGKRYELILFCKTNSLHPDCVTFAKEFGPTWYWFMDNLNVARAINASAYARLADFASATSAEVCDLFAGYNPHAFKITEGYDPQTYFPEVMEKKHDVIFVGNATPQRVDDLRVIMGAIPVTVFGNGWPADFNAAPPVFNDDLRRLINQSRIVLNFVHSNIFSDRIILSAAAGGFVLTQYCPDVETYFRAGEHLDWFRTPQEAVEKIRHYLQQAQARERIAQQGMTAVQSRLSWQAVCQRILETVENGRRTATPAQVLDSERVLFVSWHGLGDNVMLTPALRKYREKYPKRYVAVAGLKRFGNTLVQLLSGLPFVDEVLPCLPDAWNDFPDYRTGVAAVIAEGQKIAREKGFNRIIVLPTNRQDGYRLHKVFRFADEVGVRLERFEELQTELSVSNAADQAAKAFLSRLPHPWIVLHTTAGNNRKTLPPEEVEKILTRFPEGTILEFGRQSCARSVLLQETDMELSKAMIKNADRVVGIDSVVMHMAGAMRKPLTAIFTHTPIHQAIPLTCEVEILAAPNPEVQAAEYQVAKQAIEQRYGRTTSASAKEDSLSQYRKMQSVVEDRIHLGVEDYGPDAQKFLDLILQQLPPCDQLPSCPGSRKVLDLGCNAGYNTRRLAEMYGDAVGVDLNEKLVEAARLHNWPACHSMDMHQLDFTEASFDLIFAKDILEHAHDPDRVLAECLRVLKPGGYLVGLIPMDGLDECRIGLTQGNLSHYWKTNRTDLQERLQRAGFHGMEFQSHSIRQISGRVRQFGDEIVVFSARKVSAALCAGTTCATLPKISIPAKYYDADAYWAAFLTLKCTAQCPYCIQRIDKDRFQKAQKEYRALTGRQWLSFLNSLPHRAGQLLAVIGGEPTIHPDFIEIVNGLEGYRATVTTNLHSPFFEKLGESVRRLKPSSPVRFNTSFHPEIITAEKFCRRIQEIKQAGLWVDQVAMVDHPGSGFENYRKFFEGQGIALAAQSFLGVWDGRLYPDPSDLTVRNEPREHGISDMTLYREAFGARSRRAMRCSSKRFLMAPDGTIYNCCYLLYSRSENNCGSITEGRITLPEDFGACQDYGYCNPCDYPHVRFAPAVDVVDGREPAASHSSTVAATSGVMN